VPAVLFLRSLRRGPSPLSKQTRTLLHVGLALLFKMVEGIFRIGIAV